MKKRFERIAKMLQIAANKGDDVTHRILRTEMLFILPRN